MAQPLTAYKLMREFLDEKCDHVVARRLFSHFYEPILSLKLNISEDGTYSISQMELVNRLEQLTSYWIDELWNSLASIYLRATDLSSKPLLSGSEDSSNCVNISSYIQSSTDQDLVDSYYQEFGVLLKLSRLTSNLNCSTKLAIQDQTLDKLTCLIFDHLATLCFYQSGITVYNHPFVYHALFSVSTYKFSFYPPFPLVQIMN
ncbi:hypothetical protein Smp_150010 [Schistosoma mansoni]|uniref:hypothetical protein n=1 Tax=Schistosoma mansoni TaxID=6183 RepID=UPI0001A62F10|nr:hypothetical protein Smp_150010 [Schistosoma mansoni]|eukprot:XP_018651682.1 hypothetical protein Smp_150010 [Schistosoma mansoni]